MHNTCNKTIVTLLQDYERAMILCNIKKITGCLATYRKNKKLLKMHMFKLDSWAQKFKRYWDKKSWLLRLWKQFKSPFVKILLECFRYLHIEPLFFFRWCDNNFVTNVTFFLISQQCLLPSINSIHYTEEPRNGAFQGINWFYALLP